MSIISLPPVQVKIGLVGLVQDRKHRVASLFSGVLGLELGLRQLSPQFWNPPVIINPV